MSEGRLRIAAALLLTGPFTPMLFQGEEWGATSPFQYFTDHRDADLGRAVSDGRGSEFVSFGWDPEPGARPAGREHLRGVQAPLGRGRHRLPTTGCSPGTTN